MRVSLTVGKVDAGVAVLLTDDKRLIEFPSILLPPTISSGSIVDIDVTRNTASEHAEHAAFQHLQRSILSTFGTRNPSPPVLRVRNATQTAIVLEWDPLDLATAQLRSLSLYRNGAKAGAIPRPTEISSTKISGLVVDKEYTFHLILRTSAGTYSSERVDVKTHKMTDLSGITVTPGPMPSSLKQSLEASVKRMGAKIAEEVRIDTTHFVCTEGRGVAWEKAVEMNVPVVVPDWVKGCEREGRIVGVRGYYLNADPRLRSVGPGVVEQQQEAQRERQRKEEELRQKQQQDQQRRQQQEQQQQQQEGSPHAKPERSDSDLPHRGPKPTGEENAPPAIAATSDSGTDDEDADGAAAGSRPEPKEVQREPKALRQEVKPSEAEEEEEDEANDDDDDSETESEAEGAQVRGVADSPVSQQGDGDGDGGGEGAAGRAVREDDASFQEVEL